MSNRVLHRAASAQRPWLAIAVGTAALSTAANLYLPVALGRAVDAALGRPGRLSVAVANLALIMVVIVLADVAAQLAGTARAVGMTAWLRRRMTSNLLGHGMSGRRRYPPGETAAAITTGAGAAGRVMPLRLGAVLTGICPVVAVIALGWIDWMLAVVVLVGLPPLWHFAYTSTTARADFPTAQDELAERFTDALVGLRTIRAGGTVAAEVDRVLEPLDRLHSAGIRESLRRMWSTWSNGLLVAVLPVGVLALAGWSLSRGRITPGDFVAALGYTMIVLGAIERIAIFVEVRRARQAVPLVTELAADIPAVPHELPLPASPGLIQLHSVSVSVDDRLVLDRCTLIVQAGETVAIVGRPGAGKSTLVGLLGRLVEPDSGEVLIDGCSVSTMDRAQLRHAVAYAFKRPVLVGATVAEAIGYAASSRIESAVVAADADGIVRRLPRGYRTPLVDAPFSAGERQRIGLARAIAQQARVLVLDDAAPGVDVATEAAMTATLADLVPRRTRIVIAHRPATAAAADRVAWLENGVLRAVGSHESLLDEPDYEALWS